MLLGCAPCAACSCLPAACSVGACGACGRLWCRLCPLGGLLAPLLSWFSLLAPFFRLFVLARTLGGFLVPLARGRASGRASLGLVLSLGEADVRLLLPGAFWRRLFAVCALRFALRFSALVALSWRAACLGTLPAVWGLLAPLLALGVFWAVGVGSFCVA